MNPTVSSLHAAIIDGLRGKLAGIPFVEAYPVLSRRVTLPAVLVELAELEPGTDPGTGETAVIGRFQARAIVDPTQAQAHLQVRELAARIVVAIMHENWGLPIAPAQLVQAGEDAFRPELDSYLVWVVEWAHEFHLGDIEWPWPDEHLEIMLGLYPETGPGNEPDYWPVGEKPPDDWGETVKRE
jgi:hypothetical protein